MLGKLTEHWPEYLMEAAGLGIFMISACIFATPLSTQARRYDNPLPTQLFVEGSWVWPWG